MSMKGSDNQPSRLSEMEEFILRSLSKPMGKELYGLQISDAIYDVCKQRVPVGTLYPVLHKLHKKGFVDSRWEQESNKDRQGARRKYYKITSNGVQALDAIDCIRTGLMNWQPVGI